MSLYLTSLITFLIYASHISCGSHRLVLQYRPISSIRPFANAKHGGSIASPCSEYAMSTNEYKRPQQREKMKRSMKCLQSMKAAEKTKAIGSSPILVQSSVLHQTKGCGGAIFTVIAAPASSLIPLWLLLSKSYRSHRLQSYRSSSHWLWAVQLLSINAGIGCCLSGSITSAFALPNVYLLSSFPQNH